MDNEMVISISGYFGPLPDPRSDHTRRHKLIDIVTIAICAVIAGADDLEAIAAFGEAHEEWFRTFLELPGGYRRTTPSGVYFAVWTPSSLNAASRRGRQVYTASNRAK